MENKDIDEILEGMFTVLPVFCKRVLKISDDILRDQEISRPHFQIMKNLRSYGPCSMSDLGRLLSVSKPNVTTLVDKLVELNIVRRKFDDVDRRIVNIELTEQGRDYFEKLLETLKVALSKSMKKFTKDDLALFKETINNMKTLISRMIEEE
ncbi:MarR family transcriptional regulator [Desulfosporosinus fructosivorans]|uniref:MarR family transcriptional regulator n=1 Tax=Desulfosporosinus fructosivorans TaxID=2018669 RepID=A0A4Z0R7G7_9FIRM|nr:MarR family transcriptional regulator [Desulfosporosinus fructosivorans]TGE38770.1 MarR family transcriptional regulator [Desulfosporosinus fructosivorans]